MGDGNPPGPVYIEIPTDVLRERCRRAWCSTNSLHAQATAPLPPDPATSTRAAALICEAKRPLVITGRGARSSARELIRFLDASGALYLDTQESRGLVPRRASVVRRRRARSRDERGGSRDRGRAQARLPGRLRIAGGSPERALDPDRRQCRRVARESPWRGGVLRHAGAGACRARRRTAASRARSIPSGPRRCATSTCGARRSTPKRSPRRRRATTATCIPTAIFAALPRC